MYAQNYDVTYKEAEKICDNFFELLGMVLYELEEDVVIGNFGSFIHKKREKRYIAHPVTGELCLIPEKNKIKFYQSKTYRPILQELEDYDDDEEGDCEEDGENDCL